MPGPNIVVKVCERALQDLAIQYMQLAGRPVSDSFSLGHVSGTAQRSLAEGG